MATVYGDVIVKRTLVVGRRLVEGVNSEALTAAKNLAKHDAKLQRFSATENQDVILPDATTLQNGWSVKIEASGTASILVKTYHTTTPVLLKTIQSGRMYEFTLLDNSTAAGVWHINFLEEADAIAVDRYIETFNATTSWGTASGGYYTITIPGTTHEKGTSPIVQIFETSGADFILANVDEVKISSTGDISFRVPETPDLRFAGKIVVV